MEIKQFEDKNLAHFSYAIVSNGEIALIDPARDPQPYYEFARQQNAQITTVIETHPHADFVSSHLEIHNTTGAIIYASKWLGAEYPHETFDADDAIVLGTIILKALNTPGHSPDSISIVVIDEKGIERAVFTGDTLFIGDCGRPDLREHAGNIQVAREDLARQMYHSLRDQLMALPDHVLVYPAHGAGSLCGKALSKQNSSTIGDEKLSNWCLQNYSEEEFVKELLAEQPFIPKYFPFEVGINKKGAAPFEASVSKIINRIDSEHETYPENLNPEIIIIDSRPKNEFIKSHRKNAINLMDNLRFETWLGSIIAPGEKFYLIAENKKILNKLIARIAKIGYEGQIEAAFIGGEGKDKMNFFDSEELKHNQEGFTIIDVRNEDEVKTQRLFANAIHIPLHELRERTNEIPSHKPIVVHCAGGYRSAAGSSIIKSKLMDNSKVFDLSEAVKHFQK